MGNRRPPVWILFWAQLRGDPKKTAVLIVLAIVFAGVYTRLFFRKGSPQEASAADLAVAIVPPTAVAVAPAARVTPTETRVCLDRPLVRTLSRDPFAIGSDPIEDASDANGQATDDGFSPDPVQRAKAAAAQLVLESTMVGSAPLAAINGRVVRPGETIDGFVLERIEPTNVILRRHDIRVVLPLRNTRE